MSPRRIILGALICVLVMLLGLGAAWRFGASYSTSAFIVIVTVGGAVTAFVVENDRARASRPYRARPCMGLRWRRRYPQVPKAEVREFLAIISDAFVLDPNLRGRFGPDDTLIAAYRALNPHGELIVDNMEFETLAVSIERRYGIRLDAIWSDDITFGQLYDRVRGLAA